MKKIFTVFLLLVSLSSPSHAGFLDSIFGKKTEEEKAAPEEVATQADSGADSTLEAASNLAMGLLPQLTSQLGVTDTQAEGGMGSLLQAAKSQLTSEEFGLLGGGIPNMDTLLAAAPALASSDESGSSGLTGALSGLGGVASSLGGLSMLTSQFEALGLSPDMIGKFAKIAIDYFSGDGAEGSESGVGALLQKGLGSFL